MTHKNRWKSVTNFFDNGNKECVSVYGFGFTPLTCTLNHKFLVRKKYQKWNNTKRQYDRLFTKPEWVEAKDLDKNCYLGTPVFQNTENPIWDGITFNWSDGRKNRYKNEIESYINNPTFWRIIGRYIADGWNNKNGIKICCGKNEFFELDSKFKELGISYTYTEERTVYKFQITKKEWSKFVEQFGNYAYGKYLPMFIFDLPCNLLKSFVDGYISGDGCLINNLFKGSSVSKNLIYGLQMCVYKLYKTPFRLYSYENKGSTIIENRKVKIKRCYEFAFKKEKRKQDKAFFENEYIWTPINKIEYVGQKHVYDITVDEDHSFLANNKVVHNCQDFSQAGSQKGLVDENGNQTRSGLLLEVARLLLKYQECGELPKYLLMENVKALVSKKFKEKFELWLQALDLMGYNNYWKVLNAKDYGVPQNRERVFVVSIRKDIDKGTFSFPDKIVLKHRLKDLLEQNVDEKYYISDEKVAKFLEKRIEQNQQNVSTNDVIRTGNCLRPDKESGGSFAGATYNPEGCAPTLNTMEGGNRQPFVEFGDNQPTEPFCVASRGRNPNNPSDRTTGSPTEQRLEANTDFISNTITTVSKDAYVAEPSLQCVKHLGNIYQVNSHGGFNGDIFDSRYLSPTLTTMYDGSKPPYIEEVQKVGNLYPKNGQNRNVYTANGLSPTLLSGQGNVGNGIGSNNAPKIIEPNVLTPKRTEYGKAIRKEYEAGNIQESRHNMTEMQPRTDGISNTITTVQKDNMLCEPKERFFKQAIETFEQNECDVGDTVDAFNKRINSSGCSPTLNGLYGRRTRCCCTSRCICKSKI